MTRHRFSIELLETEVLSVLNDPYKHWVRDSKLDDQASGSPQDQLSLAGYPPLSAVLRTPDVLYLVVGSYLLSELLRSVMWDRVRDIKFWLDQVDDCSFDGGKLTLSGVCYSKPA